MGAVFAASGLPLAMTVEGVGFGGVLILIFLLPSS